MTWIAVDEPDDDDDLEEQAQRQEQKHEDKRCSSEGQQFAWHA
jgi:hypothetical protein